MPSTNVRAVPGASVTAPVQNAGDVTANTPPVTKAWRAAVMLSVTLSVPLPYFTTGPALSPSRTSSCLFQFTE